MKTATAVSEKPDRLDLILNRLELLSERRLAYTIKEAVEVSGCSKEAIRNAVNSRALPAKKIGQRWIITRDALVRWLSCNG